MTICGHIYIMDFATKFNYNHYLKSSKPVYSLRVALNLLSYHLCLKL